jgi:hypothetical protein
MSRGRHGWITHALFISFCVPQLIQLIMDPDVFYSFPAEADES